MKNIRPIRNDDDLAWAISEVTHYFENQPAPSTPEADRFDVLSDLIETYENKFHPIEAPEPVALLSTFMEQRGFSQADLANLFSSRSRASEVLAKKRALNIGMIRLLSSKWKMPAEPLIAPYHLEGA